MIQVVNTTSAALAAGATIPPGSVRTRTNNRVNLNGNALAQVTTTAADNVITLPVSAVIQAAPAAPGNKVALTWVTSAAGTLINASETVSRIV